MVVSGEMAKMCPDVASFRSIVEHKEKEIVGICEEQIFGLQQQLCQKDKEISELAARFLQLQDDFKYNLALLDERDAELMEYDVSTPLLQASTLEAEERMKEASNALSEAQMQISLEKQKLAELERVSERELKMLRKQLETLQKEKECHLKHLKVAEAENADLRNQIAQRRSEYCTQFQDLEKKYLDQIHKQKMDSEATVNEGLSKLQLLESEAKHLRQHLDDESQKHKKLVLDLKAQLEDKDHQMQRMHSDVKQLERELDNAKLEATLETKHLTDKFEMLEDEYEAQASQMRGQVACLTRKLEVSQTRLKDCETEKFEQLSLCNEKLHKLERAIVDKEKYYRKLEEEESSFQRTLSAQEKRLKDSELQCSKWKLEYEAAQSQVKSHQDAYAREKEKFLQATMLSDQYHAKLSKTRAGRQKLEGKVADPWSLELGLDELSDEEADGERKYDFENRRLKETIQEMNNENARLRGAVEGMRLEMESLQNHTLEEGSKALKVVEQKSDEGKVMQEEIHSLKTMLAKLASSFQKFEHDKPIVSSRASDEVAQHSTAELERSQAIMRTQLEGAINDITRITNERDLLMELSNSLRADLNRMMYSAGTDPTQAAVDSPQFGGQSVKNQIQVDGSPAPQHFRQQPELITHKGTESQQHLRSRMIKRRDPVKQKIRNYNVKDDI